jgi:hypothetical protein
MFSTSKDTAPYLSFLAVSSPQQYSALFDTIQSIRNSTIPSSAVVDVKTAKPGGWLLGLLTICPLPATPQQTAAKDQPAKGVLLCPVLARSLSVIEADITSPLQASVVACFMHAVRQIHPTVHRINMIHIPTPVSSGSWKALCSKLFDNDSDALRSEYAITTTATGKAKQGNKSIVLNVREQAISLAIAIVKHHPHPQMKTLFQEWLSIDRFCSLRPFAQLMLISALPSILSIIPSDHANIIIDSILAFASPTMSDLTTPQLVAMLLAVPGVLQSDTVAKEIKQHLTSSLVNISRTSIASWSNGTEHANSVGDDAEDGIWTAFARAAISLSPTSRNDFINVAGAHGPKLLCHMIKISTTSTQREQLLTQLRDAITKSSALQHITVQRVAVTIAHHCDASVSAGWWMGMLDLLVAQTQIDAQNRILSVLGLLAAELVSSTALTCQSGDTDSQIFCSCVPAMFDLALFKGRKDISISRLKRLAATPISGGDSSVQKIAATTLTRL